MTSERRAVSRRSVFHIGLALLIASTLTLHDARAHEREYRKGSLEIEHVYATATAPGQPNGAVFIKRLKNSGNASDRLVGGKSNAAKSVEVHQMVMDQNVMKMREIPGIELPARGRISMDRGSRDGYHLMLMNLTRPLVEGERFNMTLVFQQAGELEVEVEVLKPRGAHGHRH